MPDSPIVNCRTLYVPKSGHTDREYEDAFAADSAKGRFAIADGASESGFARPWARVLVHDYVRLSGPWSNWLPHARRRWRAKFRNRSLAWHAEAKFLEGAYATLLGIQMNGWDWHAEAVGDSCLVQIREDCIRRAFPIRRSDGFNSRPNLLGSRPKGNTDLKTKRLHLRSTWQAGDVLFLMTDALAQWFLKEVEQRRKPWHVIERLETQAQFAACMDKLRQAGDIRNDDVTLMCLQK